MAIERREPAPGEAMPDFTLSTPGGEAVMLSQAVGPNGAVVAFICNHCPYVKAMAGRLAEDARALVQAGVTTLAVMPNDWESHPEDAPERMGAFAEAHGFGFPYLVDADQEVARAWGAACTPDLFGVGPELRLVYRGAARRPRPAGERRPPQARAGRGDDRRGPPRGAPARLDGLLDQVALIRPAAERGVPRAPFLRACRGPS